jgi:hypothetical protein
MTLYEELHYRIWGDGPEREKIGLQAFLRKADKSVDTITPKKYNEVSPEAES